MSFINCLSPLEASGPLHKMACLGSIKKPIDITFTPYLNIGSILFFPIFLSFLGGQDTIFSLFGVLVWMIALLDNGDKEAGLGLALATLTPTVAGMLSIPFLFSRFRAGKWFILGTIVLGIYTIALVGVNGIYFAFSQIGFQSFFYSGRFKLFA